jgi:hypothetical protein
MHHQDGQGKDLEKSQSDKFASAVGQGIPEDIIDEFRLSAQNATPWKTYAHYPDVPFMYEILDVGEGELHLAMKKIVVAWVEVGQYHDIRE